MMKELLRVVSLLVICAITAQAQPVGDKTWQVGVDFGLSQGLDDATENWNMGFSAGANGFYLVNPNSMVGLRVAYNRWGADEEVLPTLVDEYVTITEIAPAFRFSTAWETLFNFYGQVNAGLYMTRYSDDIGALELEAESDRFGIGIGGGIAIGDYESYTFEIKPLFHFVFPSDKSYEYMSLSAAVAFKL